MEARTTVFVTGGSGFIGSRLIERLAAEGLAVRALARSDGSAAKVEALGAEAVRGELGDRASMAAGAAGCDLAFHLAAHLGEWGPWEDFERGNVEGTRNVIAACREAGVRRLVHCGTEAALMAGEPLVHVDETAPLRPDSRAPYAATKARAEQAVRDADGEGLETVVLRPRFVWGKGDTTLLPIMVEMAKAGRFAWIDGGHHKTSTTHVDNVIEGLMLGAGRGQPGEAYFVTDGEPVVFREFVTQLLATQGVSAPSRSIPSRVAGPVARAGEILWGGFGMASPPPLTRLAFWVSSQECTIRIDKARKELGYAPVRTIEEGLADLRGEHSTEPSHN
jgi:nucleoside-diphosphate-sugar epimerase